MQFIYLSSASSSNFQYGPSAFGWTSPSLHTLIRTSGCIKASWWSQHLILKSLNISNIDQFCFARSIYKQCHQCYPHVSRTSTDKIFAPTTKNRYEYKAHTSSYCQNYKKVYGTPRLIENQFRSDQYLPNEVFTWGTTLIWLLLWL